MSGKRKPRPRTIARQLEREQRSLRDNKWRLAELSDGGSPARPIEVESASIVEPRAASLPCVDCDQTCRVVSHEALPTVSDRLRRVDVLCTRCGAKRSVYFRIVGPPLN